MTPPNQNSDLDEPGEFDAHNLTLLLRSAYFALRRRCNALCSQFDCNGDQFVVLSVLSEREGITQQDLVERSGYDPATTGKMLRLLEQRGLVERKAHPTDGRAKLVTLTAIGRETWENLWESTSDMRNVLWRSMEDQDRDTVIRNLTVIASTMESYRTVAQTSGSSSPAGS